MLRQEVEAAFCGMMMRDKTALAMAATSGLSGRDFARDLHGAIFDACTKIWSEGGGTDALSVSRIVGAAHLDEIKVIRSNAPVAQAFAPYLAEVRAASQEDEIKSRLVDIGAAISSRKALQPMTNILQGIAELLMFVQAPPGSIRTVDAYQATAVSLDRLERRIADEREGKPVGITTGIKELDDCTYGLQPGFLYIVGARTGVGKTTFACNIARAAAHDGAKVAFVSVEMDASDIADKLIIREGMLNGTSYLRGRLSDDEIDRVMTGAKRVSAMPIFFVEPLVPSVDTLLFEMMRLVKVEGVQLVIVDYLQMFRGHGDRKYRSMREETMDVSTALKQFARQMNVPVVALSQLNRMAPAAGEPDLCHIAESDQIARDADVVMLIYRDTKDDHYVAVKKQRRGAELTVRLKADLVSGAFTSWKN